MVEYYSIEENQQLYGWYISRVQNPPDVTDHSSTLMFNICRSLSTDFNSRLRIWMNALEHFSKHSLNIQIDFIRTEKMFTDLGADFFDIGTEIAELAVNANQGKAFQELMFQIADKSDLSVFRFLSAWSALNNGNLELCIDECEKISDPFACVYTLQGQALLELGMVNEAIESLNLALELSPNDVMTHFQLAKASYTKDDLEQAWTALVNCQKLSPAHPEIQTFMAMVALRLKDSNLRGVRLKALLPDLISLYQLDQQNIDLLNLVLDIVFLLRDKESMQTVVDRTPWSDFRNNPNFMMNIATILRELDKNEWRGFSLAILNALTEVAS